MKHKRFTIVLLTTVIISITLTACGGSATPTAMPTVQATATIQPTTPPTATAHPTKLIGGCTPFEYDGRSYDLSVEDQIVDFRGRLHVIIVTCVVDAPMLVDAHANPDCPANADIKFDTFGGGSCSYTERFGNMEAFVWNSWRMVDPIWPAGAPSAGPDEYPDELPEPEWLSPPPPGPQA